VQGLSDHLWLANMASNSEVENSTVPLGFYVQPTGTPVDIHLVGNLLDSPDTIPSMRGWKTIRNLKEFDVRLPE